MFPSVEMCNEILLPAQLSVQARKKPGGHRLFFRLPKKGAFRSLLKLLNETAKKTHGIPLAHGLLHVSRLRLFLTHRRIYPSPARQKTGNQGRQKQLVWSLALFFGFCVRREKRKDIKRRGAGSNAKSKLPPGLASD